MKGGVIGVISLICLLFLYILITNIIFAGNKYHGDNTGIGEFFVLVGISFSIIISFILGSLLGAIYGRINNSQKTTSSKGWRIGFWTGLIFAILIWIGWSNFEPNSMYITGSIISLGILILSTLIGWIVGKIKNKNQ